MDANYIKMRHWWQFTFYFVQAVVIYLQCVDCNIKLVNCLNYIQYKFRSAEISRILLIPTMFQAANADCHRVATSPYVQNIWSDGNSAISSDKLPTRCVFSKNDGQSKIKYVRKHLKTTARNSFESVCRRNGKITANDKFKVL